MKNIKNILGMGAFMLLASLAVSSCTEKSSQSGSNLELNI